MDEQGQSDSGAARQGGICVILNAGSGKRNADEMPARIREALTERGASADLVVLGKGSDIVPATRRAVADGYGTIVAAGGDGTICAVASVLRGSGVVLGIIPLGTFNYFARSLDLPEDVAGAVGILTGGAPRPVRIAAINDRVFLNNASLGTYPAILKNREDIYRRWGRSRAAAYWSVLVTLVTLRRRMRLTIDADGVTRTVRTPLVFAVNNAFQLDQIGLQGRDEIAAGKLALYIAPDAGRWQMLRHAIALATGTAERHRDFELLGARQIRIGTSSRRRDVACDGERQPMTGPFDLRVIEEELMILGPPSRRSDLR